MIDREASPGEAATTEGERDAGDDGRATLNHQRRQRHEAGLADVRSASEQLADLLRERRQQSTAIRLWCYLNEGKSACIYVMFLCWF